MPRRTRPPRVAPRSVAGPLRMQAKAGRCIVVLTQGPYFDAKTRSRPCYKGCSRPSSCTHAVGPASARRRGAASFGQLLRKPTLPVAALDPSRAASAALCLALAGSSPEQELQRLALVVAAAGPHRRPYRTQLWLKPSHGEPLFPSAPFPGQGRRRTRQIPASRAVPASQGPHCKPPVIPRVFCVNRGYRCEELKLPGACR
jgi:hypothetical protein